MAKKHRILKEELDYVCAQRNLTLVQKQLRTLKAKGTATEEELELAQTRVDLFKEKAKQANESIARAGLSKGAI
jgi:hypothetical protein